MEYLDIYDDERNRTNRTIIRGEKLGPNDNLLAVFIVLFNNEGKMLIQKRSKDKSVAPGLWDFSAGGAVSSGESSYEGACRETLEEIGFEINKISKKPAFSQYYSKFIIDYYVVRTDWNIDQFKLQKEEVDQLKYCDFDEIKTMMEKGEFRQHSLNIISLLFEINSQTGFGEEGNNL
ncbi:NUDIX domain-containing protein [Mycoplasma sp. CSL7475-4]|uniref:NUDIX hydrolase n=1 Tax=Mycoplasma sp. CSL7475-4 TaxID=2973942 RepID=UPI00216B5286|nr:NUDIX domain-containing protein [Mycoplasma sp. CSL7475-4]MCS4536663.1 NUDIX domain-containing protein [Mycoplasma sp. CSL7475-4]